MIRFSLEKRTKERVVFPINGTGDYRVTVIQQ
jgi:hypothetical protein